MYWVTGILGALFVIAPFVLGYRDTSYAMWTSVILGAVVLVASIMEAYEEHTQTWEYWIVGIAGILAIVAPFLFGFTTVTMAMWTAILVGALMLILGGYEVLFERSS